MFQPPEPERDGCVRPVGVPCQLPGRHQRVPDTRGRQLDAGGHAWGERPAYDERPEPLRASQALPVQRDAGEEFLGGQLPDGQIDLEDDDLRQRAPEDGFEPGLEPLETRGHAGDGGGNPQLEGRRHGGLVAGFDAASRGTGHSGAPSDRSGAWLLALPLNGQMMPALKTRST